MMPWSGLLPINVKHAYEMGTSEFHLNQHHVGSPALTTDRSMHPVWSQTKAVVKVGRPKKN
jgi:hypothetical protein